MVKANPAVQKIKRITESIISLPTLPTVVSKMIELVDNPKTSAASLARLISADQALTARILKLANSAYYGFPREISTVNMAIVVIGFNTVKEMGLSLSVFEVFKDSGPDKSFDTAQFWQHCIGCGSAARLIARRFRYQFIGEAFVAGLLHDIGKVILNQYMHDEFTAILTDVAENGALLDEAENAIAGATHSQIGGWLAEKWNLPRIIVDSINHHHDPWEAKIDTVLVAIVSLANYLCHISNIGNSGRIVPIKPGERTWEIFRKASLPFDEPDLIELQTEFLLEFDKTESMMSFMHEE
jgi:HD-like signal output (HDOD) protein